MTPLSLILLLPWPFLYAREIAESMMPADNWHDAAAC